MGFGHFDDIDQPQQENQDLPKIDYLTHKVFKQTEAGRELLEYWIEHGLIMMPVVIPGQPAEAHGINEGKQEFIRDIINKIKRVEGTL